MVYLLSKIVSCYLPFLDYFYLVTSTFIYIILPSVYYLQLFHSLCNYIVKLYKGRIQQNADISTSLLYVKEVIANIVTSHSYTEEEYID